MYAEPLRILLVEDSSALAQLTSSMIQDVGHRIAGLAETVADAIELARANRPDLAIVDIALPDGCGLDLVQYFRRDDIPCIIASAYLPTSSETVMDGIPWLTKPFTERDLTAALEQAIGRLKRLKRFKRLAQPEFPDRCN